MQIETADIAYREGDARLKGFLAFDSSRSDRRPGVLVVHGGAGLDDHSRGRARRFADEGFVALACDMYGEGVIGNRERTMSTIQQLRSDRQALVRRAQPAIDALRSHDLVDGRVAVVGYCFGGMVALELARGGARIDGAVSVHGNLTTVSAEPPSIHARILVCHGALDPHAPMTQVTAFAEEMTQAGVDYQLIVYGTAMHGFTHEHATVQQNGVLYDRRSDARSSAAIRLFFIELFE